MCNVCANLERCLGYAWPVFQLITTPTPTPAAAVTSIRATVTGAFAQAIGAAIHCAIAEAATAMHGTAVC